MDIEQEAREELINEVIAMYHTTRLRDTPAAMHILSKPSVIAAFARLEAEAIRAEQQAHADFRQRVSDAVEQPLKTGENYEKLHGSVRGEAFNNHARSVDGLRQFRIPKPVDPLVEAICETWGYAGDGGHVAPKFAKHLRAACIKHGIPIPDKREEG